MISQYVSRFWVKDYTQHPKVVKVHLKVTWSAIHSGFHLFDLISHFQLLGSFCCSPANWPWGGSHSIFPLRKTSSFPSLERLPTLLGWILVLKMMPSSSQTQSGTSSINKKWMELVSILLVAKAELNILINVHIDSIEFDKPRKDIMWSMRLSAANVFSVFSLYLHPWIISFCAESSTMWFSKAYTGS